MSGFFVSHAGRDQAWAECPIAVAGDSRPLELEALVAAVANPVAAHRSLGRIGSYGLARVDRGLQLHRLTQAVLRDQLDPVGVAAYRAYAEALLVEADPGDGWDPARWPDWARILPHLLAADPATSLSSDLRGLACRAAWHLHSRGDIRPARDLAEHLHRQWREQLGSDDRHTLRSAYTHVGILVDVGPYRVTPASSARTPSLGVSGCWVTTIPTRCTQRITSRPVCIAWAPSSRPGFAATWRPTRRIMIGPLVDRVVCRE